MLNFLLPFRGIVCLAYKTSGLRAFQAAEREVSWIANKDPGPTMILGYYINNAHSKLSIYYALYHVRLHLCS